MSQFIKTGVLTLAVFFSAFGYYAAFYPVEIFFTPIGLQNSIPGEAQEEYTTFSALRITLNKDLKSPNFMSNKIIFNGSVERYHQIGLQRDFSPLFMNLMYRPHFFIGDVVTLGVEVNGVLESLYGGRNYTFTDTVATVGDAKTVFDRRGRLIPFLYIALTPDLLMYTSATFGRSSYSDDAQTVTSTYQKIDKNDDTLNIPIYSNLKKDYNIYKGEVKIIYFTPFNFRVFISPYVYKNNYHEITARSLDGKTIEGNPLLKEEGIGLALGLRHSTFRWGASEIQGATEWNHDRVLGANNYFKILFNIKLENQYFTEKFGYIMLTEWKKHYFDNIVTIIDENSGVNGQLADMEFKLDVMPIFNFSRNISIRPQYDFTYKKLGDTTVKKHRFWLHLHLLW